MPYPNETVLLEIRQMVYSLLSSAYLYEPMPEQIKAIIRESLFDHFPLHVNNENFQEGLKCLQSWTRQSKTLPLDRVLYVLKRDYTALFIGPGHLLAAPWESVYRTEEKLTFGEPTMEVREYYRSHGLEYAKKNAEPDDHFGLELEFMSHLIAKQLRFLSGGQPEEAKALEQEQLRFLQQHPGKWVDDFSLNIISSAGTLYYRGLALLAKGFLAWDIHQLNLSQDHSASG